MTFGEDSGAVISMSCKQKVNTRSSTEAELMAVDDAISQILLTKFFMEEQGYPTEVTLYQDNRSAMLLENNGRSSAGKRSRHLNIKYFYITDQVEQGLVKIEYCPTDLMKADFLTKALHGKKMKKFRNEILNIANEQDDNRDCQYYMFQELGLHMNNIRKRKMNEEMKLGEEDKFGADYLR